MSTRKLILTALICGLAIMLAGGIKLLQVATDDAEVVLLSAGEKSTLSDMTVAVESVEVEADMTIVTVSMVGVEGGDAIEGWRVVSDGEVLAPTNPTGSDRPWCETTAKSETRTCALAFPATSGAITVAYLRAGEQTQWSLAT